jgi:hypothetical protein
MFERYVCELAWTGNLVGSSTRVFQGLSAGKMEQPPTTGDGPDGPPPAPLLPVEPLPLELPLPPLELPLVPLPLPPLLVPELLPEPFDPLLDPLPPLSLEPLEPAGVGQGFVLVELAQAAAAAQVPTHNDRIRKRCIFAPPRLRRRRNASSGPAARCTSFPRKQRSIRDSQRAP